jgi:hypothetical protein
MRVVGPRETSDFHGPYVRAVLGIPPSEKQTIRTCATRTRPAGPQQPGDNRLDGFHQIARSVAEAGFEEYRNVLVRGHAGGLGALFHHDFVKIGYFG